VSLFGRGTPIVTHLICLSLAALFGWAGPAPAWGQEDRPANSLTSPITYPQWRDAPVPEKLTLCGEPIPLEEPSVYEMLDRELTIAVWDQAQVFMWVKRAGRYFPHIEKRLSQEGLPNDLKYLAVAESSLIDYIGSPAGALGVWQFMAGTGTRFGLRKDGNFDDRLSFELSTESAVQYLKKLKSLFGSWSLALAAYNCGEGRVAKEIQEQGVRDYYRLDLPIETKRFVFRIAAIKLVLEDPQKYGYFILPEKIYEPISVDRVQVDLPKEVHITEAARAAGTDYKVIKELNLQIKGRYLPPGQYEILVPKGLGPRLSAFLAQVGQVPAAKTNRTGLEYYTVKPGDTLSAVSRRTGVPIETLRRLNNIRGSHIQSGQKLRLAPDTNSDSNASR